MVLKQKVNPEETRKSGLGGRRRRTVKTEGRGKTRHLGLPIIVPVTGRTSPRLDSCLQTRRGPEDEVNRVPPRYLRVKVTATTETV